jgi:hypothetical protein
MIHLSSSLQATFAGKGFVFFLLSFKAAQLGKWLVAMGAQRLYAAPSHLVCIDYRSRYLSPRQGCALIALSPLCVPGIQDHDLLPYAAFMGFFALVRSHHHQRTCTSTPPDPPRRKGHHTLFPWVSSLSDRYLHLPGGEPHP